MSELLVWVKLYCVFSFTKVIIKGELYFLCSLKLNLKYRDLFKSKYIQFVKVLLSSNKSESSLYT